MNTQIKPYDQFRSDLVQSRSEIANALAGSPVPVDKFIRVAQTAVQINPDLLSADRKSLIGSCIRAAQDGLLPDNRESALVVYNTKNKDGSYSKLVQYMPMIAGVIKRVHNSGEIASISAHVVYEKDFFDWALGDEEKITHKPYLQGGRGQPVIVYAIVKTKDGGIYRDVMTVEDVEQIRAISRSKDGQAWKNHWSEMAKKTVLRRLAKRLPASSDRLQESLNVDAEYPGIGQQVVSPIVAQEDVPEPTKQRKPRQTKLDKLATEQQGELAPIIDAEYNDIPEDMPPMEDAELDLI